MDETTYKSAGVNLEAAEEATQSISALAKSTFTKNVVRDLGLFGGFFQFDTALYNNPVLVSSVDGVGTKLKIAFELGIHDTIGEDLVNHCVNDIMTSGAEPLFFLDYIGTGTLKPQVVTDVVKGLARGCQNAKCALIGGETAELPGFYQPGEYDIAGSIVGVVDKAKIVDGQNIKPGDILLGVSSSGLHTNGYSLARKALLEVKKHSLTRHFPELGSTLGEALLRVHRSYQPVIQALRSEPYLKGMSHITGGGILDNTRRILPETCDIRIFWENWEIPPIFKLIQQAGNITAREMQQVFNLGIGFVFVVDCHKVEQAIVKLNQFDNSVFIIGEVF